MTKHLKIVLEQWGAVLEPTRPFGSQRGGGQKVQNSRLEAVKNQFAIVLGEFVVC
jgi:hypothetical protein